MTRLSPPIPQVSTTSRGSHFPGNYGSRPFPWCCILVNYSSLILGACVLSVDTYSMTLWYPRHKLQFRIGLFYGGASAAGISCILRLYVIASAYSLNAQLRGLFRSARIWHFLHVRHSWTSWMVLDVCTSPPTQSLYPIDDIVTFDRSLRG